jgi:hypothetical protein
MSQAFDWAAGLALAMVLLLEAATIFPKGSGLLRLSTGGLILLVAGIVLASLRLMLVHQIPSFSLAPPTFFMGFSS